MSDGNTNTSADEIIMLECAALDRWGNGDPGGYLDLYAHNISYFDPMTAARVDGQATMTDYYQPFVGKIFISRYEMLNPQVFVDSNMALLTYNLVNYSRDEHGNETFGSAWNSTTVFQRQAGQWRAIHTHWSFTRHRALQGLAPEETEAQGLSAH